MIPAPIAATLSRARERLLAEREPGGWWKGELSSSALSTATACTALAMAGHGEDRSRVSAGRAWLAANQNEDGGYGDTIHSPSNLSTTALAWMALRSDGDGANAEPVESARERTAAWLRDRIGDLGPKQLASALKQVYAEDHTFAVPIQVALTASGCFDPDTRPWTHIPRLPFELAALPGSLFKFLGLPVVSYALPALIAIGQAIEYHRPSSNPLSRLARGLTRQSTLRKLEHIQPESGGYLEATPLTSFVVISLVSMGEGQRAVATEGLRFLRESMRADGSWPIDSDLATWLSTLSINALAAGGNLEQALPAPECDRLQNWLLAQQHRVPHPYTGAAPGGWAWTPLPGGVPDADDTPGALLALGHLADHHHERHHQAALWLCDLQNRDGGMPTFCKGWGKLPFDASCPDLSAHALRAWSGLDRTQLSPGDANRIHWAQESTRRFLIQTQGASGTWTPLWFGNQHTQGQENPVYGTSRVLRALRTSDDPPWRAALARGLAWLLSAQNADGGFGGDRGAVSSVEESALALEALAECAHGSLGERASLHQAMERAALFLAQATEQGTRFDPQPIGLYFAKLWYSERLYPVIFTVSALELCRPFLTEDGVHP